MIDEMIGHFEEKNENKCLVLDDVDENKEVSKNMKKFGKMLKKKLKRLMVAKKLNLRKIFKKLGLNRMMNKPIKPRLLTIIIRSVYSEDGKCYHQLFLEDTLYES